MDEAMKRAKELVEQMTLEEQAGLLKYDSAAINRKGERVQCENLAFYIGSDSAHLTKI